MNNQCDKEIETDADHANRLVDAIMALYEREQPSFPTEMTVIFHLLAVALSSIDDDERNKTLQVLRRNFPTIRAEAAMIEALDNDDEKENETMSSNIH